MCTMIQIGRLVDGRGTGRLGNHFHFEMYVSIRTVSKCIAASSTACTKGRETCRYLSDLKEDFVVDAQRSTCSNMLEKVLCASQLKCSRCLASYNA